MEPSGVVHTANVAVSRSSALMQVKFDCIVVGYERDEIGRRAMSVAVMLSRDLGSRLVVVASVRAPIATPVDVLNPSLFDDVLRDYERQIRDDFSRYGFDQWGDLQVRVSFEPAVHLILEEAKRISCDLIVVGSHGKHGLEHLVLGSVAESLATKSPCPLMVIGPECVEPQDRLQAILFASNFADTGVAPGRFAAALAQRTHSKLIAMHNEHKASSPHGREREWKEDQAREQLKLAIGINVSSEVNKTEFRTTYGDPAEEILATAISCGAGLIILGARSHSLFSDRFACRTLTKILRISRCPLIIVTDVEYRRP